MLLEVEGRRIVQQGDEERHERVHARPVVPVQVVDDVERGRALRRRQQPVLDEDADGSGDAEVLGAHEGALEGQGGGLERLHRLQDLQQRRRLFQRQHRARALAALSSASKRVWALVSPCCLSGHTPPTHRETESRAACVFDVERMQ